MEDTRKMLWELQKLSSDLSLVERNHFALATNRKENDIEHSFSVALLCWFVHDKLSLNLDLSKILKYALAHDFVERYAGDTSTFADKETRNQKLVREADALNKLTKEFKNFPDLVISIEEYEQKASEEAQFVWTIDKIQALILGELDNWRPYIDLSISFENFENKYEEISKDVPQNLKDLYESVLFFCKTTYYEQP